MSRDLEDSAQSGVGGLAELYRRHALSGRRLAYLLTGDRALAEDLVQEAFARLVGRLVTSGTGPHSTPTSGAPS